MMEPHETICIYCANACNGGCSWSDRLEPVKGWTAIENRTGPRVSACPKFKEETERPKTINTEGVLMLAEAVALQINDDYLHGTTAIRRTIENDLRGEGCRRFLQLSNTEGVIRRLRAIAKEHDEEINRKVKV